MTTRVRRSGSLRRATPIRGPMAHHTPPPSDKAVLGCAFTGCLMYFVYIAILLAMAAIALRWALS